MITLGFRIKNFSEHAETYSNLVSLLEVNEWDNEVEVLGLRSENRYSLPSALPNNKKIRIFIEINGRFVNCTVRNISSNGFSIYFDDMDKVSNFNLKREGEYTFGFVLDNKTFLCNAVLKYLLPSIQCDLVRVV